MRLIDADKLEAYGTTVPKECNAEDYLCGARDVLEHIDSMPTVDAIPVIRCKDCKYYIWEIDTCNEQHSSAHNIVHEDDYCSRAERKEE